MDVDDGSRERGAHYLAPAGAFPLQQRGEDAVRAVHACEEVADGHTHALLIIWARAGERHQAGLTPSDLVIAGTITRRAVVTEAGDRQHDQRLGQLS